MSEASALHALQQASYRDAGGALRRAWPEQRAMDAAALEAFLARPLYCVLATTTRRGRAQARPVAFAVDGRSFWCATVAGGRLANLERIPWASLVVSEGQGEAHRAVAADGPVRIAAAPPAALLERWQLRYGTRPEWAAAWLELRPERVFSYDGA